MTPRRPKGERCPADVIVNAVKVMRIATGDEPGPPRPQKEARRNSSEALLCGSCSGLIDDGDRQEGRPKQTGLVERGASPKGGAELGSCFDRVRKGEFNILCFTVQSTTADHREGRIPVTREFVRRRNRTRNLIAGEGLPFKTLCIETCLTAVVVGAGGLAVGHGVLERDPGGL